MQEISIYISHYNALVPNGLFAYIYPMNIKHDRTKVVEKGIELFWQNGYNNLGVDAICKSTGMPKGAFYNAYNSKENFLLECLSSYNTMNVEFLNKLIKRRNNSAVERLLGMYVYMLKELPKQDFSGCMMNNMMSEIGSINEKVSEITAQLFDNLVEVIEPVVKEAQQEGDLSNNIDSNTITELIHSTFFGVLTRAKSTKDTSKAIHTMTTLINSLK